MVSAAYVNNTARVIWQNYYDVAAVAASSGNWGTASLMYRESLSTATEAGLTEEEAFTCHGLALVLLQTRQSEEAERFLRRAIRLYSLLTPLAARGLASVVSVLADLYTARNADERALPLLKMCERSITTVYGVQAPELLPIVSRMALIYNRHSQHGKAEECVKHYRSLKEKLLFNPASQA
ncbi:MAG TPA: tetratricopeptide repeat protein [Candidatus Obscuribacter sp.]|nr:tetratricopeptide repeat protein [Candidatus Obscuribacter sp.]MBK9280363.1 tetratricopeptide repeat protein [Candidatus Obscuribacter sp.]HMW90168.1 tetratricopeptide repeat protein [Candidatus Obscuribacter sp.]HMX47717.1 tetratricopeptide repeat protein [Candidatus Obscuribacter sp.]HNB18259.1 tetratricopeptide repeat protein [Candidatus Obscuribacter sp.]